MKALLLIPLLSPCFAADRLAPAHLDAVHTKRVEWMQQRASAVVLGVYQDFRAVTALPSASTFEMLEAARAAEAQVVLSPTSGTYSGILFLNNVPDLPHFEEQSLEAAVNKPSQRRSLDTKFKHYPDEVFAVAGDKLLDSKSPGERAFAAASRNASVHVLARDLDESQVRSSLAEGRLYLAHDWLCDPTGFSFIAQTDIGVYEIGDHAPMLHTVIEAHLPLPAKTKLLRDGVVVAQADASNLVSYAAKEEGAYRLEAWLTIDGEDRLWIQSNPIYVGKPPALSLPAAAPSPAVEVRKDITYVDGDAADEAKHKLDLYLPKEKKNFPLIVFVHGGTWRTGDRSLYAALGYRFAKAGIGVAIPSYRLMPQHPHPAQIEDVAAAFAWVYRNAAQVEGDAKRLYLVGHSAGGHLVTLLALDDSYLKAYGVPPGAIRGVAALSGVYDVSRTTSFLSEKNARDPSPMSFVHAPAPSFLLTYCQWDYLGLPKQARDFAAALKKDFVLTQLVYIPDESHVSEILSTLKDDDKTARAILNFVR